MHVQNGEGNIHISTPGGNAGGGLQPFHGIVCRPTENGEVRDIRKAANIQSAFRKGNKFTDDFEQSTKVKLLLYEHYGGQNNLCTYQMTNLFMYCLDGPARLFFLLNVQLGDTYEKIKGMMLSEYFGRTPAASRRSSAATPSPQPHGGGEHDRCQQGSIRLGEQNRRALAAVPTGITDRPK